MERKIMGPLDMSFNDVMIAGQRFNTRNVSPNMPAVRKPLASIYGASMEENIQNDRSELQRLKGRQEVVNPNAKIPTEQKLGFMDRMRKIFGISEAPKQEIAAPIKQQENKPAAEVKHPPKKHPHSHKQAHAPKHHAPTAHAAEKARTPVDSGITVGENRNIDDETRQRALAWAAQQNQD